MQENGQGNALPMEQQKTEVTFSDAELVDDQPASTFGFASRLVGSLWGGNKQEKQKEREQEQEQFAATPMRPPVAVTDLLDVDADDGAREDEL